MPIPTVTCRLSGFDFIAALQVCLPSRLQVGTAGTIGIRHHVFLQFHVAILFMRRMFCEGVWAQGVSCGGRVFHVEGGHALSYLAHGSCGL